MLRAKAKQCWFSWVVMDAHLVSVVSLPAVVTLQQKERYMNCKYTRGYYKKKYIEEFRVQLFTISFVSLFRGEKKDEGKETSSRIAISVNISAGNMHVSAKFRSVFMPNVLKRILFAVGQRVGGIESTCEPTTSSSNFPLHYLVSAAWRFIPWNLVYDHSRDCVYENKIK